MCSFLVKNIIFSCDNINRLCQWNGHEYYKSNRIKIIESEYFADNNSYEQWTADGALDTAQRANLIWKKMLNEYQAPDLDPAVDEALLDFMARRKGSFADRDY